MTEKNKNYTEHFKEKQEKLKKRAKELFSENDLSDEEPQFMGDPSRIFEEDKDDENHHK